MISSYLPAVPRPPHDPFHVRLDCRAGWRTDATPGLTNQVDMSPADGNLTLTPLPGTGRLLNEASGSFGGLTWPDHVVALPEDGLILLDRSRGILRRFDPCLCRFADWPCLGKTPALASPGGIAAGCAQLYLCDTENHRLLVLSLRTGALRAVWTRPSVPGLVEWQPKDVATDGAANVYVSDPANGAVHVFSIYGRYRRSILNLGAVSSLALDRCGLLYIRVDGETFVTAIDPASGRTVEKPVRPEQVLGRFPALPVRVLANGWVDVSALCVCPPNPCVVVDGGGEPPPKNPDPDEATDPCKDIVPAYPLQGTWVSSPLDSEIARCTWDRVAIEGRIGDHQRVEVYTWSSESEESSDQVALVPSDEWTHAGTWRKDSGGSDFLIRSSPGRYLWLKLILFGDGTETPRLRAVEIDYPRISLRRYLPSIFGANPVAADFTDRFLEVFDRQFRDTEKIIDTQARFFDPMACPAGPGRKDFLTWLASWVGVGLERSWPEARRRAYLKHAPALFPWRGTVKGLRQSLYLFLGLDRWLTYRPARAACAPCGLPLPTGWRPPRLILEHFQLRRWMFLDHAKLSDHAKLWGERVVNRTRLEEPPRTGETTSSGARLGVTQLNTTQDPYRDPFHVYAHRMSVFAPAVCTRDAAIARALARLVSLERPAHVDVRIIPVEPRFRVGVQSMLGLDAVIGLRAQPVTLDQAKLGRATVLPSAVDDRPLFRVGDARVGMKTILP